jgi:hypothetical protein
VENMAWARSRRFDPQSDLRVSTAERSEVADLLSQYYAEGRLDETEFSERIEQATEAKTRADLSALLTDLPAPEGSAPLPIPRRRRPLLLAVVVGVSIAIGAAWVLSAPHFGWLLVAVLVWIVWRRRLIPGRRTTHRSPFT